DTGRRETARAPSSDFPWRLEGAATKRGAHEIHDSPRLARLEIEHRPPPACVDHRRFPGPSRRCPASRGRREPSSPPDLAPTAARALLAAKARGLTHCGLADQAAVDHVNASRVLDYRHSDDRL